MMSAFVEKAREHLSIVAGAAFRNEWELFDEECKAFCAHLEAREAVTRKLAEALKDALRFLPPSSFDAACAALQAYDEASK